MSKSSEQKGGGILNTANYKEEAMLNIIRYYLSDKVNNKEYLSDKVYNKGFLLGKISALKSYAFIYGFMELEQELDQKLEALITNECD